jgi:hypothetical protein
LEEKLQQEKVVVCLFNYLKHRGNHLKDYTQLEKFPSQLQMDSLNKDGYFRDNENASKFTNSQ